MLLLLLLCGGAGGGRVDVTVHGGVALLASGARATFVLATLITSTCKARGCTGFGVRLPTAVRPTSAITSPSCSSPCC